MPPLCAQCLCGFCRGIMVRIDACIDTVNDIIWAPLSHQLTSDECNDTITCTKPQEIIAITSILPVSRESVYCSELMDDTHLAVYAVSNQPATESPTQVTIGAQSPSNDQIDALAKAGTLHGESWTFHALPPNPSVAAVTRRQHATGTHTPASFHIAISPQFAADDLLTLQNADSSLRTMAAHMSDPLKHPISTSDLNTSSELRTLHSIKHMLYLRDGILTYVPEPLTAPKLVVPHGQRGMILTHTQTMHHAQDTMVSRPPMKHSSKWHTGLACSKT